MRARIEGRSKLYDFWTIWISARVPDNRGCGRMP
jgi:hypothetical protein